MKKVKWDRLYDGKWGMLLSIRENQVRTILFSMALCGVLYYNDFYRSNRL